MADVAEIEVARMKKDDDGNDDSNNDDDDEEEEEDDDGEMCWVEQRYNEKLKSKWFLSSAMCKQGRT